MATSETYFPSTYLKASDIDGEAVATIAEFGEAVLQTSSKAQPIISFGDELKPMILNVTNFKTIEALYGDTDGWVSKKVTLYVTEVNWKGDMVPALRIRKEVPEPVLVPEDGDIHLERRSGPRFGLFLGFALGHARKVTSKGTPFKKGKP